MADGWQTKACVQAGATIDSGAKPLELTSHTLQKKQTLLNTQGVYGTRSQRGERTRISQEVVAGSLVLPWSPASGAVLLPFVLGANASGTTFALAETLPEFVVQIDAATAVYTYANLVATKGTWRAQPGGFVEFTLDVMGQDESAGAAGSGQSLTAPLDQPYLLSDAVLTLDGDAYTIFNIELSVDNKVQSRFGNSVTATRNAPADLREVAISFDNPFTSNEVALYNDALGGVAIVLALTNGTVSTTFTMAYVEFPSMTPIMAGKSEMPLKMQGIARMTGSTKELVVVHDSTV